MTFQNPTPDGQIPNSQLLYLANLRRNSHDPNTFAGDEFRAPAIFQAAANPQSGHVYLVYHDREPVTAPDTDILFQYSTNAGVNWFAPTRINDVQSGDQWQPCMAVKPDGTKLFIGWYDRKHDVTYNHRVRVRGMISTITSQTPLSSPTYFDISAEDFAPVFTGAQTADGTFDPVYGGPLAIDYFNGSHPTYGGVCNWVREQWRCGRFSDHMGDYDQVLADSSYIYYCWGDNRVRRNGRLQADVRFKKISW